MVLSGWRRFVLIRVLVPGPWSVQQAHDLYEQLEHEIATTLTRTPVLTHLESIEDPTTWDDQSFRWEQG